VRRVTLNLPLSLWHLRGDPCPPFFSARCARLDLSSFPTFLALEKPLLTFQAPCGRTPFPSTISEEEW